MKRIYTLLSFVITFIIPFVLIMAAIRILLSPFFLDYEYNSSNFPPDEYGFSTQDRLHWGKISLEYLTSQTGIDFLADQKLSDGTFLYNDRELSHMVDVKNLIDSSLVVWYCAIITILILLFWSWKKNWMHDFWRGISRGGFLTLGLIVLVIFGIFSNFDALFTGFHALFFTGDSWLFYTSDSLIRLFPEKLWSDAFLFMGIFTLCGAIVFTFLGLRLSQKRQ